MAAVVSDLTATMIVDISVDVWSLGVLAWHMLSGRPLFDPRTKDEHVLSMLLG